MSSPLGRADGGCHRVRLAAKGHAGQLLFQQVEDGKLDHGLGVRCHSRKIHALQPRARHVHNRHTTLGHARCELARMDRRNNAITLPALWDLVEPSAAEGCISRIQ